MKGDFVAMLPDCVQDDREMCHERKRKKLSDILDGFNFLERQFLKLLLPPRKKGKIKQYKTKYESI